MRFAPAYADGAHKYRTGDYWLIAARTETGDVEWPRASDGAPEALGPGGVRHHYAPLAVITLADRAPVVDCLQGFRPA